MKRRQTPRAHDRRRGPIPARSSLPVTSSPPPRGASLADMDAWRKASVRELMAAQHAAFVAKFGRAPRPEDPVFFDPSKDVPTPLSAAQVEELQADLAEALRRSGVDPAKAYATQKTGLIPVEGVNTHLLSDQDREDWDAAIEEYGRLS